MYLVRLSKFLGVETQADVARVTVTDEDADARARRGVAIVRSSPVGIDAQRPCRESRRRRCLAFGLEDHAQRSRRKKTGYGRASIQPYVRLFKCFEFLVLSAGEAFDVEARNIPGRKDARLTSLSHGEITSHSSSFPFKADGNDQPCSLVAPQSRRPATSD